MSFQNCKVVGQVKRDDYHRPSGNRGDKDYVMSRSELMLFHECPSKWILGSRPEETDAMEWGTWMDSALLTPDAFKRDYVKCPETYMAEPKRKMDEPEAKPWNRNATVCKEWEAEQRANGREPLRVDDVLEIEAGIASMKRRTDLWDLISKSKTQMMLVGEWKEDDLIIPVKSLLDIVPDDRPWIIDLKQTTNASPAKWMWKVADMAYHAQGSFYLQMWNTAMPESNPRTHFGFIVQESKPPYHVERHVLSDDLLLEGGWRIHHAFADYAKCLKTGVWPDYPPANAAAEKLDGWHVTQLHERMMG